MFFAPILVDDMTSSITVPGSLRIPKLRDCAYGTTHAGKTYYSTSVSSMMDSLLQDHYELQKGRGPIICGYEYELERFRRFFALQNIYRVELESHGQRAYVYPNSIQGCPSGIAAPRCRIAGSFIDVTEWNEYVSILSRFDLLKNFFRGIMKDSLSFLERKIRVRHRCCENKENLREEVTTFLFKLRRKGSTSGKSREEFFLAITGTCIALMAFAAKSWRNIFLRIWLRSRVKKPEHKRSHR